MVDRGGASQVDERLQEALFIMAVTNSVINPLIYGTVGRKQDCKKRLNALRRTSTCRHPVIQFLCCYCCLCKRCCDQPEHNNSETVVLTLNRINSRMRRNSRLSNGGSPSMSPSPNLHQFRHHYGHSQNSPLMDNRRNASPASSSPSPTTRNQIVTLKKTDNNNSGNAFRFVRNFVGRSSAQRSTMNEELFIQRKDDCIECGVPITLQYIVPVVPETSGSQKSTHV